MSAVKPAEMTVTIVMMEEQTSTRKSQGVTRSANHAKDQAGARIERPLASAYCRFSVSGDKRIVYAGTASCSAVADWSFQMALLAGNDVERRAMLFNQLVSMTLFRCAIGDNTPIANQDDAVRIRDREIQIVGDERERVNRTRDPRLISPYTADGVVHEVCVVA